MPEERPRLVWLLGTTAAVLGVSLEGNLLWLTSDMPLSRLQDLSLSVNLPVLCRVGESRAGGIVPVSLCPSLPGNLAPLQLCAATVASVTAVTAACDSHSWRWAAQRDLTYSLGLGGGTGKLEKGIGWLE